MTPDQLWALLPAELRSRDEAAGGLLHGIVTVFAEHSQVVEGDLDQFWADLFIETCAEWVVPYLGDLVGVSSLHPLTGTAAFSNRARVANTIRFRRRKGTAAMLEELARTTTGWTAAAVEFFEHTVTTQHVNHVRPHAPGTAAIRDAGAMELVGGPFDPTSHTVDVRPMPGARHNLPNVGLYVWPFASYPLDRATAAPVADPPDSRYLIDPLGVDHQLAGPTVTEPGIDHRAGEPNVPGPLRRRPLHDELDALRATPPLPDSARRWFRDDSPSFVVWLQPTANDPLSSVDLAELRVCDLSDWKLATGTRVRVDPVLGRVTVAANRPVHRLAVSWSYAAAGDLGAGPYPRPGVGTAEVDWQLGVSATDPPRPNEVVATLGEAVDAWHAFQSAHPGSRGRIVLMDSHRFVEDLTSGGRVQVGQGSRLEVVAAGWPQPEDRPRGAGDPLVAAGVRPCLVGDVEIVGTGTGERPGQFALDGLLLAGSLTVVSPAAGGSGLGLLDVRHSTVVPDVPPGPGIRPGIVVEVGNDRAEVILERVITGPIRFAGPEGSAGPLTATDCLIAAPPTKAAIDAPGADTELDGVTALGTTTVRSLAASDCVFDATVLVARRQQGCVRFSHVPPGSQTPRRYRCQPDLAIAAAPGDPDVPTRVAPAYGSLRYGAPAYGRLAGTAARELREGAESGAEMGAYRHTLTPQRLTNLATALGEYLPLTRVAAALPVLPNRGDLT